MNTRCKLGDLAIVIQEYPGCEDNVGRLVEITGHAHVNRYQQLTWLIQPVSLEPWLIIDIDGSLRFMRFKESGIEHPDAWMAPLPPHQQETDCEERQDVPRTHEVTTTNS
jgi:hypothetical protein